ncbi:MAG: hypothetical protein DSY40_03970 [Nautilia sp.]|nr:MAG: hypothetical protein DSY40_03970 [Nautilia sp.]
MKKGLVAILSIAAISTFTACSDKHEEVHNNEHHEEWGYTGEYGPENWGKLKPEYKMCAIGKQQTPINIKATKIESYKFIDMEYEHGAKNVINNGHTVQVNVKEGNIIKIDGKEYELKQFHFHTPSENHIKGKEYPLEAHFVHASKDGKLAVISVMFKENEENKILSKIWSKFPLKKGEKVELELSANDIKNLMPSNKSYYKFMGSLTTPPCSEGVTWIVFKNPVNVSKEQVKAFFNLLGHANNRPIQPTNDREIILYK